MGVDYRVFHGYGYEISNEKAFNLLPEKYDELVDSDYIQFLDGYSDERRCFFGIIITTVPGCDIVPIPSTINIDDNDYKNMIAEYKSIFNEDPGPAQYYIGFAVT